MGGSLTLMGFLGYVGVVGMGGGVASSGIQSGNQSDAIRKNIGDIDEATAEWTEDYAKLNNTINSETGYIIDACTNLQEDYGAIITKLKVNRQKHAESLKSTQMIGIIFITIIFFALLLKTFNLLGPLSHILSMPEKFIWNYIVHGKRGKRGGGK
jgi:hypothetical protein